MDTGTVCVSKAVPSLSPSFSGRLTYRGLLRASMIGRISLHQTLYHALIDPRVPLLVRPEELLRGRVDFTHFPLDPRRMH